MSNYKIASVIIVFVILVSISIGISCEQVFSISSNSSSHSHSLSPENIVNGFMSIGGSSSGGGQLTGNNGSSQFVTGASQAIPSNNTHTNNALVNTSNISSQNASNSNNVDFPKIFKSAKQSIVQVTAYNSSNHTIFKTGSGFIYSYKGTPTIITVSNLVAGKNDITVTLANGSSYYSNLTGYDPLTNLATLSVKNIPKSNLVSLNLGNSSNLEEGQPVLAIGNTFGFKNVITTGIIGGLQQSIPILSEDNSSTKSLPKMPIGILTNLNLGNGYGGSPLLDTQGKVIGMNIGNYTFSDSTAKANNNSPPKNIGISFAVPSDTILKIIPSLLSKGYYEHPWFGAAGTDVDLDIAKALNLNESRGFLVIDVAPSSPAKKAGILGGDNTTSINGRQITLGGDIILKIDNKDIQNIHDILAYIENNKKVGDDILVTVLRNGLLQYNTVKLESNPNYLPPLNR